MTAKKEIIKSIESLSGKYSPYEVFSDWIRCCALAIQNNCCMIHDKVWQDREQAYIDTMRRYEAQERIEFCKMFALLGDALTDDLTDILGEIYMEMQMGSKASGQFFTPFHLSELTARTSMQSVIEAFDGSVIELNEPSSGGGGMIIAAAKVLRDAGINPQKYLRVVAQDLDWKGVYMSYLQLSLIGIRAVVVQGDTLKEPYDRNYPKNRIMITPAELLGGVTWLLEEADAG